MPFIGMISEENTENCIRREILDKLAYIILDEIHYINDRDRGTVWEEIIIFRDKKTKILGLSATVPNAKDLSNWMESISGQPCKLIQYDERIVKQTHAYYDKKRGPMDYQDMVYELYKAEQRGKLPKKTTHIDFIKYANKNNLFPILFFSFSRRSCEELAEEAAITHSLLSKEDSDKVKTLAEQFEYEYPELLESPSWQKVTLDALSGVCCHHAGLLPLAKRFVETLFEKKLCRVLYATETFAIGINFPVRTVCFTSLRKFDGYGFRNLNGSEYLQMAGRAGRRGFDELGKVFTLVNYEDLLRERLPDISLMKPEPVKSQFALSYNTVINLSCNYEIEEARLIFEKGLSDFQYKETLKVLDPNCKVIGTEICPAYINLNKKLKKETDKSKLRHCPKEKRKKCEKYLSSIKKSNNHSPSRLLTYDFDKKVRLLNHLSYMNEDKKLEARGEFCKNFHVQELLLTELLIEKDIVNLPMSRFVGIIGGLAYDGRDEYPKVRDEQEVYETISYLNVKEYEFGIQPKNSFNARGYQIVKMWMEDKSYDEISCMHDIEEGDFVSIMHRTIDLLRQVKVAFANDIEVVKYVNTCIKKANRGIVEHFM